jgi:hypothetical protein|tara:strand:+ start:278 stop:511 length:234 start_codon:yes stop_codon:yes gene_type:complete
MNKKYRIIKIDTLKEANIFRIIFNDEYYTDSIIDQIKAFKVINKFLENFDKKYNSICDVKDINGSTVVDISLSLKIN